MSQFSKLRYRTTDCLSYNAALKSRSSLTIWLDKRMQWFAAASGKRGRSPKFSDAAIQFCLTMKNLFGLALRHGGVTFAFVRAAFARGLDGHQVLG
ncbi:DDE family transposase [Comamonas sp. AG1104]|nr:DDE family transposase [Comamonas sp. AG1104]